MDAAYDWAKREEEHQSDRLATAVSIAASACSNALSTGGISAPGCALAIATLLEEEDAHDRAVEARKEAWEEYKDAFQDFYECADEHKHLMDPDVIEDVADRILEDRF
jgi:phosphosulfolactate phosphohydrolase-like enzyme